LALASALMSAVAAHAQQAETIASCGEMAGFSYYPVQAYVPADKAGWLDDAITGGQVWRCRWPVPSSDRG
jgi:hypothetical protein